MLVQHHPYRSSHQRCSLKKGALRNFAKFTGKHLFQYLFFNKVAGLLPHIGTNQLICCANQLTGFYMWATGLELYLERDSGTDVFL